MRRALLVGAGSMGRNWARVLQESEDACLAGWVDLREATVRQAATDLGLRDVALDTDLGRALATIRPDFVVDVTVPGAHHAVTLQALGAGVPVLGEKPMADSMERAREMVAAADRAGLLYMVSQNRRHNPALAALRRLIAEQTGALGILNSDFSIGARERGHRLEIASPLLLDMAIHAFDTARYLSGADPVSVYCEEFNPPWSWYRGNACATAVFELTGGVRYTYRGSWCSEGHHTDWDCEWRAVGPHGTAIWKGGDDVPVADMVVARGGFLPETEARRGEVVPAPSGIAGSLHDFLRALDTGEVPMGECHDNIKSLAMVFGAIESASSGHRASCRLWDGA
jgi:predicted dehydrogenase